MSFLSTSIVHYSPKASGEFRSIFKTFPLLFLYAK